MTASPWLLPPERLLSRLRRSGSGLVLTSLFPTWDHLREALVSAIILTCGLQFALLAGQVQRAQTFLAPRQAPFVLAGAALISLYAWRRLRAIRPYRLHLTANGLTADAPPHAPLTAERLARPRRSGATRISLAWAEITAAEVGPDGLVLRGRNRSLALPWRYQRRLGFRLGPTRLSAAVPAFPFDELDWLAGLVERLRGGDLAALHDLRGVRARETPEPVAEPTSSTLAWLGPARLHIATVLVSAAVATLIGWQTGSLPLPMHP